MNKVLYAAVSAMLYQYCYNRTGFIQLTTSIIECSTWMKKREREREGEREREKREREREGLECLCCTFMSRDVSGI